jgi:hypothetical protein
MTWLWWTWAIGTVLYVVLVITTGLATGNGWLGILVDARGRYSLSRLQLVLWMGVVLPLIAAAFTGRLTVSGVDPFDFAIPAAVLGVIGISIGSTVVAGGIKAHKDSVRPDMVAASPPGGAVLVQLLLLEEGPDADRTVDLTKIQQLVITVILVGAYVASTTHTFLGHGPGVPIQGPADITSLPDFDSTFLLLLGISQTGYLAGKVPNRGLTGAAEDRPGYTVVDRRQDAQGEPRLDRKRFRSWRRHHRDQLRLAARRSGAGADQGTSRDSAADGIDVPTLVR